MILLFYFFAGVLILLSYKSFRGGIAYRKYFKTELAKSRSDFTLFASIITPCRGVDPGLAENLSALFEQDYPAYEIVFVVDDEADPAAVLISELINHRDTEAQRKKNEKIFSVSPCLRGKNIVSAKLVIAPKAIGSSQKVENQREAVLHVSEESLIFAFVDSDTRPSSNWLRELAAPLQDEKIGSATGYRWFIAENPTFGSEMRSVWNASIASALGPNTRTNFCWGGSMAIRRDTFDRLGIREKWLGTLSDDFTVTRAIRSAGMPIIFVPQALTATVEDCSLAEMLEFTTRQMKITRVYAPHLWLISFFGSAVFNAVLLAAFLMIIFSRQNILPVIVSIATIALVLIFSLGKSWLRLKAVRLALPEYEARLRPQSWTQNALWLFAPVLFFFNCFAALLSRRMTWRGTTYELKSPTETVIIAD